MKDYNEIANNVFQRRDKYLEEKKRKKAVIFRNAAIALSCCIMIAVGIGIWNSGMLRNIKPSPNKEDYSLPQPVVTTTEAASDNDPTVTATVEVSTDNIITTAAPATNVSAQSKANTARTTTAEKQNGSSNVTATRSESKTEAGQIRTTASSIEITSPSNNSSQNSRTTSHHSGAATTTRNPVLTTATRSSSRTTATRTSTRTTSTRTTSRTTAPPRTTSRTTLPPVATTTIAKTTRVYTSTTAVYTRPSYTTTTTAVYTHPIYTSTTIVYTYSPVATSTTMATSTRPAYSTTIGYTSMSHSNYDTTMVYTSMAPVYSTTVTKSPELPSTTSMATTIPTEIFANHTIYDILPNTIPDTALAHDYIGSSNDRYACNLYKYMDFDPDFLCLALFSNNEPRLAASYEYDPETIGEIIDTQGFWNNLSLSGFYDYKARRYTRYNDKDSLYGFLDSVRDTPLEEGLFLDTETDTDLIASLYYNIYVSYDDEKLSGVIYLTDNGILQVNINIEALELQYAFKIGEQAVEQLYSTLRSNV